jgi:hypothetical protein
MNAKRLLKMTNVTTNLGMKSLYPVLFAISLILNIGLYGYIVFMDSLDWTVDARYGVLKEDTYIGEFNGNTPILMLPKGLTVKDVSPANNIDLFEPRRFSITISSDRELVDYTGKNLQNFHDLYSADGWKK